MRIPLATPLQTRDGTTLKDAKLVNAYVEMNGDQGVVRKRPASNLRASLNTGVAQGGIGIGNSIYVFNGDAQTKITKNNIVQQSTVASSGFPGNITISPDQLFVYVVDVAGVMTQGHINQYSRNPTTGVLTALTPANINAHLAPYQLVINPSGTAIFIINYDSNDIYCYSRNTTTGLLTYSSTVTVNTGPRTICINHAGNYVYVAHANAANDEIYIFSTTGATLSYIASVSTSIIANPYDIRVSPDDTCLIMTASGQNLVYVYTVSTGGAFAFVNTYATGAGPFGGVFSPDSLYYYVANNTAGNISIFSRNPATNVLSPVTTTTLSGCYYLYISDDGLTLFATGSTGIVAQFNRNISTGLLTQVESTSVTSGSYNMALSSDGNYIYISNGAASTVTQYGRFL
jgi:6-phosphogluconolactonase (cycloisomerase 2 family)